MTMWKGQRQRSLVSDLVLAKPRSSTGSKHDPGRFHGAAVLDAHQTVAYRVLPDRHARAGAPPSLHGFPIGAAIGDEAQELQGKRRRGGAFGGFGACFSGLADVQIPITA